MEELFSLAECRRALALIVPEGATVELRAPKTHRKTMSGYYTDMARLAEDAGRISGRVPGVYVTVNPVRPDLIARANNRLRDWADFTTTDQDVTRRCWLPIDFDPCLPAGISSTDEEHAAALTRARECRSWLEGRGWDGLLLGDSGNGGHVLAPVQWPNDDEARRRAEGLLKALAAQFTDQQVKVDLTTFNAARIWKLYGTLACKGDNFPGSDEVPPRPWRLARLLDE